MYRGEAGKEMNGAGSEGGAGEGNGRIGEPGEADGV